MYCYDVYSTAYLNSAWNVTMAVCLLMHVSKVSVGRCTHVLLSSEVLLGGAVDLRVRGHCSVVVVLAVAVASWGAALLRLSWPSQRPLRLI